MSPLRRKIPEDPVLVLANERFKQGWDRLLFGGLVLALVVHILVFWLVPPIDVTLRRSATEALALEPPLDVQPAPALPRIPPPSGRGILRGVASEQIVPPPPPTPERPPAPPPITFRELVAGPTFTPYEIAPELKNREEAISALGRFYPDGRRGGGHTRLQLWFLLDRFGAVRRTLVKESSGLADVDRAVLRAAELMEFTPAWSGNRRVPVWIALPIAFELEAIVPIADTTAVS